MWVTKLKYLLYRFLHTQKWVCFENFDQTSEVFQEFVDDG